MLKKSHLFAVFALIMFCLSGYLPTSAQPQHSPRDLVLMASGVEGDINALQMRPIDPSTLQDLPGYTPISLQHHFNEAYSPDGRTLAMALWTSGSAYTEGTLHLIDLLAWKDQATSVKFPDWISCLTFDSEGKRLYWIAATEVDKLHGIASRSALYRYDLGSVAPELVLSLPASLIVYQCRLLPSLNRLAIYGLHVDAEGLTHEPPHIVLIDFKTQKLAADLQLDGIIDGQYKLEDRGLSDTGYGGDTAAVAWNVEANLVYVAHPVLNRIAVVDLKAGKITRLWNVPETVLKAPGPAKLSPGNDSMAVLSQQDDRLYVARTRRTVGQRDDGSFNFDTTPLGFQALDLRGLHQSYQSALPVSQLALSPDGNTLLATGTTFQLRGQKDKTVSSGLYIINAADGSVIKHFDNLEENIYFQGFSADSRMAYITSYSASDAVTPLKLRGINLKTLDVVERSTASNGYIHLIGTYGQMQVN